MVKAIKALKNHKFLEKPFSNPIVCLILLSIAMSFGFSAWRVLLDNFAIHKAGFGGVQIGILQSIREIPGLLAFGVILLVLWIKEQRLAYIALLAMGAGVALTGFFPSTTGLWMTTLLMSLGFHYYEAVQTSLTMQWVSKEDYPLAASLQLSGRSIASLGAYVLILIGVNFFALDYLYLYLITGFLSAGLALFCWRRFPLFPQKVTQHKGFVLRKRYRLYYWLTFLAGARRQIFVVFAGFLMVQKFGFDVTIIVALNMANFTINSFASLYMAKFIKLFGERNMLIFEYAMLILIFCGYGLVQNPHMAMGLYLLDNLFFSFSVALKSYFKKIADDKDLSGSASVSFSINHIAAIILPITLGLVWVTNNALVFYIGALFAVVSLVSAFFVPRFNILNAKK